MKSAYLILLYGMSHLIPSSMTAPSFPMHKRQLNQTTACTNTPQNFDESCWDGLGLSQWLAGWSLPTCADGQINGKGDASNCCKSDDNWSHCFLRVAVGEDLYNCTQFNTGSCAQVPQILSNTLNSTIVPQVWYVVKNIFAINAFFSTWNQAITAAALDANLISNDLIQLVDPEKQTHVSLGNTLTAIGVGLAFLVAPEIAPEAAVAVAIGETAANVAARALVTGLQQAPTVAQAIWPAGTENSQPVQLGDVQSQLASQTSDLSNNLNAGLGLLMSDIPSFIAFANAGYFSGDSAPSLTNDTDVMGLALRTYVISSALSQNSFQGMLFTDGSSAFLGSGTIDQYCQKNPNACYTNTTSGVTYRIGLQGVRGGDTGLPIMNALAQNQWTAPSALFDGAFQCAANGNFGESVVNYNADGSLDLSCMSQLVECSTNENSKNSAGTCPSGLVNGGCPIRWCVSQVPGA